MIHRTANWSKQALLALTCICVVIGASERLNGFEITAEQRREARAIQNEIRAAETRLRTENFDGCAEMVAQIQPRLERLVVGADAEMIKFTENHFKRLQILHGQLELEGYQLTDLAVPSMDAPMTAGTVSFSEQVAPILVSRCGRCHVNRRQGGVSLASFATIMQGPAEGKIVFAGDSIGSRLVEVIDDGTMPPNGQPVSPDELAILKTWIEEGAKYDGEDEATVLSQLGSMPDDQPAMAAAEVVAETGSETIHFSSDIAPILVENCSGCHINAQNASGNLNMTTFRGLIRGGNAGSMIVQGKPADSLLIGKLKGTAGGQRMPQGRPALADDVIAKIEKWIEEGATYDGGDPNLPVPTVAALAKARAATHEDLSKERLELALANWQLAMPGVTPKHVENDQFVVMGDYDEAKLTETLELAEEVAPTIGRMFRARAKEPLVKGRITIYLVKQRYDYSEFGKMIEERQLPDAWRGHWRFTTVDSYGVTIMPRNEEDFSLEAMLGQQIAGNLVASLGPDVPIWFSEGVSRVAAARVARDDPRVLEWQEQFTAAATKMQRPADFITGRIGGEDRFVVSYRFVEFLMSDNQRFTSLITSLRSGGSFDASFQAAYGGKANEVATAWARSN